MDEFLNCGPSRKARRITAPSPMYLMLHFAPMSAAQAVDKNPEKTKPGYAKGLWLKIFQPMDTSFLINSFKT